MSIIPIAAWHPDQPDLVESGSSSVRNCLMRTKNSFGPMPSLAVYSGALTARCQGAAGVTDASGNALAFAGDASKLYQAASGATAWSDVSKVGGYSTAGDGRWSPAFWTPNLMLMSNFNDAIQAFTIGTSSVFADLSATAPKARYLAVIRDFVMAFNVFDATDGARPTRAHWCAIGDPTNWPAAGTSAAAAVQSDFQDINLGDFGWGMGIVGGLGSADGAMFFERGVVRVNYVGPPDIFGFYAVEGARGTSAPGSIAQLGSFVIYLGSDDLYAFDGSTSVPLGAEKFCKTLFADIDQSKMDRICSAFDPINKLYFLAYPGPGNNNGACNRILAYNWDLKEATIIDGLADIELIFRSLSFGYTLDGLDAVSSSLDLLPFSLDSRAWTGGALLLSAFDTSHRLNYFTGANLAATIDTSEAQLIPNMRAFVSSVRPLIDGGTPSVSIGTRERQIDAKTFGAAVALNILGDCPQLSGGRYHTARVTTLAGDSWSHFAGVDVPDDAVSPDGVR